MMRKAPAAIMALAAATFSVDVPAYPQPIPGGLCRPVHERKAEVGCWILEHKPVGQFKGPASWYLHLFPDRGAAERAKGARGTVLEAFGKVWLFTVDEAGWKGPAGGSLQVEVAPLPIAPGSDYSAQFMEAVFTPGMASAVHVHSGPEAFYTLEGETCLETPEGKQLSRGGGPPVIIADGPMHLTASGTALRRGLVLILHRTGEPATTRVHHWTPRGLCKE
jgi:hypothetical protein